MIRRSVRMVIPFVTALVLVVIPAMASASSHMHAPKHRLGHSTSTNWSGYSVDGTNATFVAASWIQPYATNCGTVANSWSSPWVGIDGDNSNTVEQTGTDSDCSRGVPNYYAWWEMYPKSTVVIPTITVHPGDMFTATVSYGSAGFTLSLTDVTTGKSFTTVQTSKKALRTSVEWIMEGPSSGNLTDFGSVNFMSAYATIGGQSVTPGSSDASAITMVTGQSANRALPSLTGPNSFSVGWLHS